jgi:outer membrane immunogenic protein
MRWLARIGIGIGMAVAAPLATLAADFGRPPAYRVLPPGVITAWTGCYVGINVGGGWVSGTASDALAGASLGNINASGFSGGGQIGCDYQIGNFVVGLQGMANFDDIRGSNPTPGGLGTSNNFNVPWHETLTARLGYAVLPMGMVYVKGGGAWVRDNYTILAGGTPFATGIITPNGWTGGVGFEYRFIQNWSAFVEYNYLGFGSQPISMITTAGASMPVNLSSHSIQAVLIGVNLRFGGWY